MSWPRLGQRAAERRIFSAEDVSRFALLTGDLNPVHLDSEYAARTRFGRPIVHGMLAASMFSTLLAMRVPGRGAVYLSQSMRFRAPIYVGEEVEATVEIIAVDETRSRLTLATRLVRADGAEAITGEAVVLFQGSSEAERGRVTDGSDSAA
ncbi:MAG: MaoC family dehydratase [Chloroflexi bacterium]|nr:MaoC family dehydratase [Chloroflexota bacterium]